VHQLDSKTKPITSTCYPKESYQCLALASLHNMVVVTALLLFPALFSSTGSADIVVCGSCRQHCTGIFAGIALALSSSLCWHLCASHRGVIVVPGLIVISCFGQCPHLWWSMPAPHWHLCRRCAGIVSLIPRASLGDILVVAALLLYLTLSSSTALADVVVCGGHLLCCTGVVSFMTLASFPRQA
jgi:hypothetical protein